MKKQNKKTNNLYQANKLNHLQEMNTNTVYASFSENVMIFFYNQA